MQEVKAKEAAWSSEAEGYLQKHLLNKYTSRTTNNSYSKIHSKEGIHLEEETVSAVHVLFL